MIQFFLMNIAIILLTNAGEDRAKAVFPDLKTTQFCDWTSLFAVIPMKINRMYYIRKNDGALTISKIIRYKCRPSLLYGLIIFSLS